ncbi:MAG TPA: hypothetical protein VG942_03890 [Hyphomonadaceae bacterium]|nr:hypothetical protein [Hyphomonadaceae bacterium]
MTDQPSDPNRPGPHQVTEKEKEAAFGLPSAFVTKSIITVSGPFARLTFFEIAEISGANLSFPKVSVTMPLGDLLHLRDLITQLESNFRMIPPAQDKADGEKH